LLRLVGTAAALLFICHGVYLVDGICEMSVAIKRNLSVLREIRVYASAKTPFDVGLI
jgi:hypothetical protein